MTITVEDGSGVSDANSYVSLAEADQHFASISDHAWNRKSDADKTGALIQASQYADMFNYPGSRLKEDQGLKWPRIGVSDSEGRRMSGIPAALRSAVFEKAGEAVKGEPSSQILREKVGNIDLTYDRKREGSSFAYRLLQLIGASGTATTLSRG